MKGRIHAYTVVAIVAVVMAALAGCRSEEPVAIGDETSLEAVPVPTLTQVAKAVTLDDDDKAVVSAALGEWQKTVAEETAKPFRHVRAGMAFIATVAPSLDNEQFSDLVDFLGRYRDEHMKDMRREHHAKGGRRGAGARHEKLAESLGLTKDQQAAMKAIHTETREKMREQHEAFRAGTVTEEQMEEAMRALHDAQRAKVAGVLTEAQLAKLDEMRDERRERKINRRIEHMDARADAHVEWLTTVLGLSADQRSTLEAALEAAVAERKAGLESVRDGSASRREARVELRDHH
jgi:hypothetical protein